MMPAVISRWSRQPFRNDLARPHDRFSLPASGSGDDDARRESVTAFMPKRPLRTRSRSPDQGSPRRWSHGGTSQNGVSGILRRPGLHNRPDDLASFAFYSATRFGAGGAWINSYKQTFGPGIAERFRLAEQHRATRSRASTTTTRGRNSAHGFRFSGVTRSVFADGTRHCTKDRNA